jgi:hypothetical protein
VHGPVDPSRATREVLAGAGRRGLVFFGSIPIAYAISTSLAQWCRLLLVVLAVPDRRRRRRRREEYG